MQNYGWKMMAAKIILPSIILQNLDEPGRRARLLAFRQAPK
jgi:hypothetical protein